jgi:hypothetical protein
MTFRRTIDGATAIKPIRHLIVLADHARLPGRFFGRMTAAIQAAL